MPNRMIFLLMPLLLVGCPAVDLRELNFTRNKPTIEDLVGTWTPDSKSRGDIKTRGSYINANPEVILRADGSFSIRQMPDWWSSGTGESKGTLESLDGQWSLRRDKNIWDIWTLNLKTPDLITSIHLYRQKPPYALFIGVGDPNDAHVMFFERLNQP